MNTHRIPSKVVCQFPDKVRPGRIEVDFSAGEITSDGGDGAIVRHSGRYC